MTTPRPMTKSPRAVAREALRLAQAALPAYSSKFSRKHSSRLWTKLTVACDTASHFLTGAAVTLGPANDSPQLRPVMAQATLCVGCDRVLADAAFDSEEGHRHCREQLGVRSTVIPLN